MTDRVTVPHPADIDCRSAGHKLLLRTVGPKQLSDRLCKVQLDLLAATLVVTDKRHF
jgi:hypothetical protein